ncbi:ATP-binding protein [Streptomyces sp. NPDC088925]|uniref:ATP-binding protein n=1 Tax=Streptomyces sp. NPDC088925 TaxID=3365914 RepID=UPI0037FB7D35
MHDVKASLAPPLPRPVAAPGYYQAPRPGGIELHMSTSSEHMSRMRAAVSDAVRAGGKSEEAVEAARLVASELVGNAVAACGACTPVIVQVFVDAEHVVIQVHDPEGGAMPVRREPERFDESGRGLLILDHLAPGWAARRTPFGKQVTATLSLPSTT